MKGVIAIALRDLVKEKFGNDKWEAVLKDAGFDREPAMLPISDLDDKAVLGIIGSVCKVLNISLSQAADAFGDYWMNVYAPKVYKNYLSGKKNARDFLLKMDGLHNQVTSSIKNAHPPRFTYEWKDDRTLIMTYNSARKLIDIFVGLLKGVGKYFKEDLKITKLDSDKVEIVFQ